MKLVDLSHPLFDRAPAFPNDPKLGIVPFARGATHPYNLSQIVMGSHQGTHLDAMFHFYDDGRTLDQMPLEWFYGPARVLRIPKPANGVIGVADLEPHAGHLQPEAKIFIETGWHREFGSERFFSDFPGLDLDAARYLAGTGIRVLGLDIPTLGKEYLELHHILLHRDTEVVVVESVAHLDAVPDTFTWIGFPLPFRGGDGSPIRSVALCETP